MGACSPGGFSHWHGIRICACLLGHFFTKFGIAIGGFSSETKEPKLHKLGVFWANYCKRHPIWSKWVLFFRKWYTDGWEIWQKIGIEIVRFSRSGRHIHVQKCCFQNWFSAQMRLLELDFGQFLGLGTEYLPNLGLGILSRKQEFCDFLVQMGSCGTTHIPVTLYKVCTPRCGPLAPPPPGFTNTYLFHSCPLHRLVDMYIGNHLLDLYNWLHFGMGNYHIHQFLSNKNNRKQKWQTQVTDAQPNFHCAVFWRRTSPTKILHQWKQHPYNVWLVLTLLWDFGPKLFSQSSCSSNTCSRSSCSQSMNNLR